MQLEEEYARIKVHAASAMNCNNSSVRVTLQVVSKSERRGNHPIKKKKKNALQHKTILIVQWFSVERERKKKKSSEQVQFPAGPQQLFKELSLTLLNS